MLGIFKEWQYASMVYHNIPFGYEILAVFVIIVFSLFFINKKKDIGRLKYLPLVLFFPYFYFIYEDHYMLFLFIKSAINPYYYYAYSPGFWMVDFAFWVCTPLFYLGFRKKTGRLASLFFAFAFDFSAVGIFLLYFCAVYGINIFADTTNTYYASMIYFAMMGIIPINFMKFNKKQIIIPAIFAISGIIWRIVGTGKVIYVVSPSVIIDMAMIGFCFFMFLSFVDIHIGRLSILKREVYNEI